MMPENYNELNWVIKRSILDPVRLFAWEAMNAPKIIPSKKEAEKIGLDANWQTYLGAE